MSAKQYRPWLPTQSFLLPPSPSEWLPEGDLAYFILDVGEQLDMSGIEAAFQEKDPRGTRPYDPRMLTVVLLYGYCVGVASSRKIEAATYRDVAFRVLSGGLHPDHTVISEFRRRFLRELGGLFVQVLRLCQEAGLVKLGHVALDGSKVGANASKHKAMSYERMLKTQDELGEEVAQLLKRAENVDQDEDACFGVGKKDEDLPAELRRREDRLARIAAARSALEAEAAKTRAQELAKQAERAEKEAAQAKGADKERADKRSQRAKSKARSAFAKAVDKGRDRVTKLAETAVAQLAEGLPAGRRRAQQLERQCKGAEQSLGELLGTDVVPPVGAQGPAVVRLPQGRIAADADGNPKPKAQWNFTDPDSRIMKGTNGFVQAFNCQAMVDAQCQVIVACDATNQAADPEHLEAMLEQTSKNCGGPPVKMSADAGYWSVRNAMLCEAAGIDAYIAVRREKHGARTRDETSASGDPRSLREQMRLKLQSAAGKEVYSRRKVIVEPVFGQTKSGRGLRTFLMRGTQKVRGEWRLWCTGNNLLKLFRATGRLVAGVLPDADATPLPAPA